MGFHRAPRGLVGRVLAGTAVAAVVAGGATALLSNTFADAGTTPAGKGGPTAASAHFSPYVDTSLQPPFNLVDASKASGAKNFNLAFITDGGGCTPKWGGQGDLGSDPVAKQIPDLRKAGGDVRISFGGANGNELALGCQSADQLAAAYQKVIDQFKVTKLDFDVEGGALTNTAANTRRAQAAKALQAKNSGLEISYTLPVLPTGLTTDGVNAVKNAKDNGVKISAVNVMAMDYGSGPAPDPSKMGDYAIQSAQATAKQTGLPLTNIGITPMIGVNDTQGETFTPAQAKQVEQWAAQNHLAWLSMWSATRDKACSGGGGSAQPTCSGVNQQPWDFSKAFAAYGG